MFSGKNVREETCIKFYHFHSIIGPSTNQKRFKCFEAARSCHFRKTERQIQRKNSAQKERKMLGNIGDCTKLSLLQIADQTTKGLVNQRNFTSLIEVKLLRLKYFNETR